MKTSAQKIVTIIGFGNVGRAIAHLLINMDDGTSRQAIQLQNLINFGIGVDF